MDGDLQNLPDDAETLKAMIADMRRSQSSLQAEVAALRAAGVDAQARIDRLQLLLKTIQRATYGRSSEKLDESQYAFTFEEVQTGLGAVDAMLQKLSPTPPRKSGGRRPLPAHLERVEEIIEPDDQPCSCGACARVKIGEDVSERLDVVAPKFRVIVTRRPRYACQACRENIVQAPAPARLIAGGIATERLLAGIAVSKYADGLPLYRQEAIFAREKVELGRNLMASWMGHVGFHLEPLADRLFQLIRAGDRIFADETTLPVLAPGRGRTRKGWLWTYLRDDRPYGGAGRRLSSIASKTAALRDASNAIWPGGRAFSNATAIPPIASSRNLTGPAGRPRWPAVGRICGASSTNSTSRACRKQLPGRLSASLTCGPWRSKSKAAIRQPGLQRGVARQRRSSMSSWPGGKAS